MEPTVDRRDGRQEPAQGGVRDKAMSHRISLVIISQRPTQEQWKTATTPPEERHRCFCRAEPRFGAFESNEIEGCWDRLRNVQY